MASCSANPRVKATLGAACEGRFGLVRHYSWQTPLCSKQCVDRFKARRESDRHWLGCLEIVFEQFSDNHARGL